jgi:hypothetical protein
VEFLFPCGILFFLVIDLVPLGTTGTSNQTLFAKNSKKTLIVVKGERERILWYMTLNVGASTLTLSCFIFVEVHAFATTHQLKHHDNLTFSHLYQKDC